MMNLMRNEQVKFKFAWCSGKIIWTKCRWPHRMLPSGEWRWVCRRDRHTDRRTDTIALH